VGIGGLLLSWSGGKDSMMSLHELKGSGEKVVGLLATFNEAFGRASMHGVRVELIRTQADSLGIPLYEVWLPYPCSNELYEERMGDAVRRFMEQGIRRFAFGDIFLEDVRAYRERQLGMVGAEALFPLWGRKPDEIARSFISLGFEAVVICVDGGKLDPTFLGRRFDAGFLEDLPEDVDPCGEKGEFHTFVWSGPGFRNPVAFSFGERVLRDGFWFQDLIPRA
jgi:uncharacterized protein (TIGR00290 family)